MFSLNRLITVISFMIMGVWCSGFVFQKRLVVRSFYYWKHSYSYYYPNYQPEEGDYGITQYDGLSNDYKTVDTSLLRARRAYIKFFDVDWRTGNGPFPREIFEYPKKSAGTLEVVPVFALTNRVFEKSDSADLDNLVGRLSKAVAGDYLEIQLDCDWTEKTRDRYFQFIKRLRQKLPLSTKISATVGLQQFKNRDKMGIPPVDRAMLLFFNFGNLPDFKGENAIFDLAEARKYLEGLQQYPLQLDVSLPVFRWGLNHREGKVLDKLTGFNAKQADSLRFLTKKDRLYTVNADTVFNEKKLRKGDKIKISEISDDILRGAAELAAPLVRHTEILHLTYFQYNKTLISSLKPETYEQVFKIFNR